MRCWPGSIPPKSATSCRSSAASCARGIAVLMIEHVMQAVMSLAEHVFVLAEGRIIARGQPGPSGGRSRRRRGLSRPRRGRQSSGIAACPLSPSSSVHGLYAGYGDTEVLRGVDLHVEAGEIVAVLGSNGVGKSTLNRTISGIVRARAGAIRFDGADIAREAAGDDRQTRAHPRARGPPDFPQPVGQREPRPRQLSPRRRTPRRKPRARVRDLPAPVRAARASVPARCRAASSRCSPSAAA